MARRGRDRYLEAQSLSDLAMTSLRMGGYLQAIQRATEALSILQDMGLRVSMTTDLSTLAEAYLKCGDAGQALERVEQNLAILEECRGEGPDYPQRDYFVCYRVLASLGRATESQRALRSAHNMLMHQADKINEPDLRASFLKNMWFNRRNPS